MEINLEGEQENKPITILYPFLFFLKKRTQNL